MARTARRRRKQMINNNSHLSGLGISRIRKHHPDYYAAQNARAKFQVAKPKAKAKK